MSGRSFGYRYRSSTLAKTLSSESWIPRAVARIGNSSSFNFSTLASGKLWRMISSVQYGARRLRSNTRSCSGRTVSFRIRWIVCRDASARWASVPKQMTSASRQRGQFRRPGNFIPRRMIREAISRLTVRIEFNEYLPGWPVEPGQELRSDSGEPKLLFGGSPPIHPDRRHWPEQPAPRSRPIGHTHRRNSPARRRSAARPGTRPRGLRRWQGLEPFPCSITYRWRRAACRSADKSARPRSPVSPGTRP